jgi:glucose/arabinose dehydrogenase
MVAVGCGGANPSSPTGPTTAPETQATPAATPRSAPRTQAAAPRRAAGRLFGLRRVTGGLDEPVAIGVAPGDPRVYVVEQAGVVRVVAGGRIRPRPFADLRSRIVSGGEQGLLGIAFHPGYRRNGRVFLYWTARDDGANSVWEFHVRQPSAAAARIEVASGRRLLAVEDFAGNHNGGQLAFGPDGMLYVALGDGGGGGDPEENGQDRHELLGKILRVDVNRRPGGRPYGIPRGNPFRAPFRREIWAYGLRNPWRFSFDRDTGDLWIGDVGQGAWEEVDRAPAGRGGLNFGWDAFEGPSRFEGGVARSRTVPPVAAYSHESGGGCSVIGGFVYRGRRVPGLRGRYLYADYCSGKAWTLRAGRRGRPRDVSGLVGDRFNGITSFGQTNGGELLAVTSGGDGTLWRIVP